MAVEVGARQAIHCNRHAVAVDFFKPSCVCRYLSKQIHVAGVRPRYTRFARSGSREVMCRGRVRGRTLEIGRELGVVSDKGGDAMTNGCFQRLILSGALLLLPFTALAQNLATGTITGVVRDNSGAVLPGVTVEAASPALIEKVRTVVDRRSGRVSHHRIATRDLHGHVHSHGVLDLASCRRRAHDGVYGDGQCPARGRWAGKKRSR